MKDTVIIYYSYTGSTKLLAEQAAARLDADLICLRDRVRPGTLKAYTAGCLAAMRMKRWPIEPVPAKLSEYSKIVIYAPVWAGCPAPAANNVFDWLPEGKDVEITLVSASGKSDAQEKICAEVEKRGCRLAALETIKSASAK